MFPTLCKKANVAHIVHDYGFSYQAEDEHIYQKAIEDKRIVVTINFKDFHKLVKPGQPGIIGIPSQLTNSEIDAILSRFISLNKVEDCIGKGIKI